VTSGSIPSIPTIDNFFEGSTFFGDDTKKPDAQGNRVCI